MQILNNVFTGLYDWFNNLLLNVLPGWATWLVMNVGVMVILIVFGVVGMLGWTWMERKVVARIADRLGPNRAGPFGVLVAVADAIKMLTKEDITPTRADRWVFLMGPILILIPAVLLFAVVPFGKGMIAADLNIGILYVMALGSVAIMAILMAGWGSNNKYALLGAFRAVAQLIAYEVPMALSLVTVVLLSGTLSTYGIVLKQASVPFVLIVPAAFVVYLLCGIAEIGRSPFDLLEADSEIVAGYNIEYSGMKFALFYISEYFNLFTISAMVTTLFLGGWQWPILPSWLWFMIKCIAVVFVMMWIRGTWPRIRIDQMLNLSWKVLVPVALVNLFFVGLVLKLISSPLPQAVVLLGGNVALILVTLGIMGRAARRFEQKVQSLAAQGLRLQPNED